MISGSIASIINNMQQLHECKDMKDDHFSKRRKRGANIDSYNKSLERVTDDNNDGLQYADDSGTPIMMKPKG